MINTCKILRVIAIRTYWAEQLIFLSKMRISAQYVRIVRIGHSYVLGSKKRVLHPWALFLKNLYIFSKNKATSDKVSYGSGQKCSKELKNHSFASVETIVVKLQWKMCENQYFWCFEP